MAVSVQEQWLKHGDEIATGDSSFLFLLEDENLVPGSGRVEFEESQQHRRNHDHSS